jgi:hypothetical protein
VYPVRETIRILKHWSSSTPHRFGNRYFENLNAEQEVPGTSTSTRESMEFNSLSSGRHRWVDFAQVGHERVLSKRANLNLFFFRVARFQCLASTCRMACMAFPHSKGDTAGGCSHAEFHAVMESGVYHSFLPLSGFTSPTLLPCSFVCYAR